MASGEYPGPKLLNSSGSSRAALPLNLLEEVLAVEEFGLDVLRSLVQEFPVEGRIVRERRAHRDRGRESAEVEARAHAIGAQNSMS